MGQVTIDFRTLRAMHGARELHLTHREFKVLRYLAERRDRIVHRDELLREVWGYLSTPTTRSVDLAIARLRKKIEEEPYRPRFILTVHADGDLLSNTALHQTIRAFEAALHERACRQCHQLRLEHLWQNLT